MPISNFEARKKIRICFPRGKFGKGKFYFYIRELIHHRDWLEGLGKGISPLV
jgi:hypothetical protein